MAGCAAITYRLPLRAPAPKEPEGAGVTSKGKVLR